MPFNASVSFVLTEIPLVAENTYCALFKSKHLFYSFFFFFLDFLWLVDTLIQSLMQSYLFFAGPSSPYLPPSRPWERKDPSSLWLPFDPEPFSCPLARSEAPEERRAILFKPTTSRYLASYCIKISPDSLGNKHCFHLTELIKPSVCDLTQHGGLTAEEMHFIWCDYGGSALSESAECSAEHGKQKKDWIMRAPSLYLSTSPFLIHRDAEPKASAVSVKTVIHHLWYTHTHTHHILPHLSQYHTVIGLELLIHISVPLLNAAAVLRRHTWRLPFDRELKNKKKTQAQGGEKSKRISPDLTFLVSPIDRALIKYLASNSDKQNKPPDRF